MLLIIYGDIGTGKTTLAKGFAEKYSFDVICFDDLAPRVIQRPIYNADGSFALSPEETQKVYDEMHLQARELLNKGNDVVLESMYFATQRNNAYTLTSDVKLVHVTCSDDEILARVAKRKIQNPQSPGSELFLAYKGKIGEEQKPHISIDTTGKIVEESMAELARQIGV